MEKIVLSYTALDPLQFDMASAWMMLSLNAALDLVSLKDLRSCCMSCSLKFSSAFNTMELSLLRKKMEDAGAD